MVIYRVEDKHNGKGAWSSPRRWPELANDDNALHSLFNCTLPDQKWLGSQYRFGCDSIKKLEEYFGNGLKYLLADDFEIVAYKVRKNHVRFSPQGIEVAFVADKAERIVVK